MLAKIPWNPSDRQLRQFGVCAVVALPLLGWLTIGRTTPSTWTGADVAIFSSFTTCGLLAGLLAWMSPQSLKLPFLAATMLTLPIGIVVGELLLVAIYFGLFAPIALFFRLIGRDALERRIDANAVSYWAPKPRPVSAEQYFRQS